MLGNWIAKAPRTGFAAEIKGAIKEDYTEMGKKARWGLDYRIGNTILCSPEVLRPVSEVC